MDSIGHLPTTSKGNRFGLTFISLLISYLITLLLKTANDVSMAYVKDIFPKTCAVNLSYRTMVWNLKVSN